MLAHSVMNVVFVPDETINQGTRKGDGQENPKSIDMDRSYNVPQWRIELKNSSETR